MVFKNLSEMEVLNLYFKLKDEGLSQDEIFTEIYAIDCGKDYEDED